jgi:hypothetical protein
MREAVVRGQARYVYEALQEPELSDVLAILRRLENDPTVDNRTTFDLPRPPLMLRLFDNGIWQVTYWLPDEATVAIIGIVRIWPPQQ